MVQRIYLDESILFQLYIVERKSIKEMSEILGVTKPVISRNLKECGIEVRDNSKEKIEKNILEELYIKKQMSIRDIAKFINVPQTRVRYSLSYHQIVRRDKSWKSSSSKNGAYVKCEICGKEVYRKSYNLKKFAIFFCSWNCEKQHQSISRSNSELPHSWRSRSGYKSWRRMVLERDGRKCKVCRSRKNVVAHHIVEAQNCPEMRLDVDNGISVCKSCHIKIHQEGSEKHIESLRGAILLANP